VELETLPTEEQEDFLVQQQENPEQVEEVLAQLHQQVEVEVAKLMLLTQELIMLDPEEMEEAAKLYVV
jgi:hypothetical protein